ncbi:uncharacterized protein LAESUDRAFT_270836 [Laetiporus sulphureus 93-53]|uniref:Uncharacterized protein n=1 Tax=Laetiporus sulphureus 93-53 TaxID=1314785 RepID=A0A165H9Z7_9APHY|nr:uncharacterized protein LAESUDRAFT_270836 [Laetiporus sulphureus 93-53]KZT11447.1 hypothetical protein LAESUDRAFT_270836 [Laetiporus sulphureus 93-53]
MSVASDQMLSAANTGLSMFFASPPGSMSVNSNLSLDWQSVHFGYPEQARFHTSGINDRYLRVFRANLTRMDNGRRASSGKAVDICFAVPSWAKSIVETTLAAELGAPDFPDTIMLAK